MNIRTPLPSTVALACILPAAHAQERGVTLPSSNGRRMALIIGNDSYPSMPLHNAATMPAPFKKRSRNPASTRP